MAIVSAGYAGTVNDLQWAQLSRYFAMPYGVKDAAACAVTQQGSTKTFNVAAGEFYGRGILDASDSTVNVAPTVPGSGGQWFLLVARRVWATKVTSFIAIAAATTTTTTPTAPPVSLPTISTNPGTQDDQPIAWVWVNSANTTVVIFDLRVRSDQNLWGRTPTFPNTYSREAHMPSPVTGQRTRVATDLWDREWNGSAWRPAGSGLLPVKPASVAGTGVTLNADGSVAFAAATQIDLNGVFTADFTDYDLILTLNKSAAVAIRGRLMNAGVPVTTNYRYQMLYALGSAPSTASAGGAATPTHFFLGTTTSTRGVTRALIMNPALAQITRTISQENSSPEAGGDPLYALMVSQAHELATAYDGLSIIPDAAANLTGRLSIRGYA